MSSFTQKKTYRNFCTDARYLPFEARKETHEQRKTKIDLDEFRSRTTNITLSPVITWISFKSTDVHTGRGYSICHFFFSAAQNPTLHKSKKRDGPQTDHITISITPHFKTRLRTLPRPPSQTIAIAVQWNCRLWQHHGMEHIMWRCQYQAKFCCGSTILLENCSWTILLRYSLLHLLRVGWRNLFFQLCCCVSFLFWWEIGFGCTYWVTAKIRLNGLDQI